MADLERRLERRDERAVVRPAAHKPVDLDRVVFPMVVGELHVEDLLRRRRLERLEPSWLVAEPAHVSARVSHAVVAEGRAQDVDEVDGRVAVLQVELDTAAAQLLRNANAN